MRRRYWVPGLSMLTLGVALASGMALTWPDQTYPPGDPGDQEQVILGAALYGRDCARCHGDDMGGELGWAREEAGLSNEDIEAISKRLGDVAPAHDEHGTTSRLPDEVLFRIIDEGPAKVLKKPESRMTGFHDRLAQDEIWAIIAFMKDHWQQVDGPGIVN